MAAAFFWDRSGDCKDPLTAIKELAGSRAKARLSDYWQGSQSLDLPANNAILMGGRNRDLLAALNEDFKQGQGRLKDILVKDLMAVWYVRHRPSTFAKKETIVSIASVPSYWGMRLNDRPEIASGYRWCRLYQGHAVNGGIGLDALINQLLPAAKHVGTWPLQSVEVAAREVFLRTWTPQGLVMSLIPPPNPVRLVGDLRAAFDAPAQQATLAYINGAITDLNNTAKYKVQLDNMFPPVVEQFMKDVDRSEIRVGSLALAPPDNRPSPLEGGNRAWGTLLVKAPGSADPRLVLLRFAGTPGAALGLSKMVCQLLTSSISLALMKGVFVNANGEKLTTNFSGTLPGNAKDQFVSMRRRGDGFTIDYEIEAPLKGFSKGGQSFRLDSNASWIKLSMQIRISAGDLEDPRKLSNYRVSLPPTVAIHTEMDIASLEQQMAAL